MYWHKYTDTGSIFGIDDFGKSGPASKVFDFFKLNVNEISKSILRKVKKWKK